MSIESKEGEGSEYEPGREGGGGGGGGGEGEYRLPSYIHNWLSYLPKHNMLKQQELALKHGNRHQAFEEWRNAIQDRPQFYAGLILFCQLH